MPVFTYATHASIHTCHTSQYSHMCGMPALTHATRASIHTCQYSLLDTFVVKVGIISCQCFFCIWLFIISKRFRLIVTASLSCLWQHCVTSHHVTSHVHESRHVTWRLVTWITSEVSCYMNQSRHACMSHVTWRDSCTCDVTDWCNTRLEKCFMWDATRRVIHVRWDSKSDSCMMRRVIHVWCDSRRSLVSHSSNTRLYTSLLRHSLCFSPCLSLAHSIAI